jgi:hypothetical protein
MSTTTNKEEKKEYNKVIDEVEVQYQSFFFRKDIIDEFSNKLNNKVYIYNLDDIYRYLFRNGPEVRNSTKKQTENRTDYKKNYEKLQDEIIEIMNQQICRNIGSGYVENTLTKSVKKKDRHFDIIIIFESDIFENRILESTKEEILKVKLSEAVGFLVVELGECKMYPHAYSINLICTSGRGNSTGSILMGLYLYTILSHPKKPNDDNNPIQIPNNGNGKLKTTYESHRNITTKKEIFETKDDLIEISHIGVLELASAYSNLPGLCMYEKFGFNYDPKMTSDGSDDPNKPPCFRDIYNLPMILDFSSKYGNDVERNKKRVVDIINGSDRGFTKSKICYLNNAKNKDILGILKNIKIHIENPNYIKYSGADINFKSLVSKFISNIESLKLLDHFITSIETDNIPNDNNQIINKFINLFYYVDVVVDDGIRKILTYNIRSIQNLINEHVNQQKMQQPQMQEGRQSVCDNLSCSIQGGRKKNKTRKHKNKNKKNAKTSAKANAKTSAKANAKASAKAKKTKS